MDNNDLDIKIVAVFFIIVMFILVQYDRRNIRRIWRSY